MPLPHRPPGDRVDRPSAARHRPRGIRCPSAPLAARHRPHRAGAVRGLRVRRVAGRRGPFTQRSTTRGAASSGASGLGQRELGAADALPAPRRDPRRGADDPAHPDLAVRDPPLALGAVLPHRGARGQHRSSRSSRRTSSTARVRPTTSRTACSARCSRSTTARSPRGTRSARASCSSRSPRSCRPRSDSCGGSSAPDRGRHDLAAHPHQRALVLGRVFGVIGGASATLVLWWAFSTLLAKDYGKPLFRRRIESPAHEGAS